MKTIYILYSLVVLSIAGITFSACTEEEVGPILKDSSTFESPVWKNAATRESVEFLPDNAADLYEKFEWVRTQYGVQLSTNYIIQIDDTEDFNAPQILFQTSGDTAIITVEAINNAMLALGLPGFEESTVYLRLRSTINGLDDTDTLYSDVITRVATTYQSSECGNHCTVGIVGSATAGGWDVDTDMRLADATKTDKYTWTIITYLNVGAAKFRANDNWDANWGGDDFPSGTGVQGGGDIPISVAGYYKVTLNDNTGAYTFTALAAPEFTTIGILGSGTAGGWESDTDLTQDENDPHVWTGVITLTEGAGKFRAENGWDTNWGSDTYPSGYGVGGGADIPVKAGTFFVWFNDVTGEYYFMPQDRSNPYDLIGIIGTSTPGGWDSDTDLIQNPVNPFLWSKTLVLVEGVSKFRADDDWGINWGGSGFPGGIGAQGGPDIPTKAGKYFVTLNTSTGEYYFLK